MKTLISLFFFIHPYLLKICRNLIFLLSISTLLSKLVEVHPVGKKLLSAGKLGWRDIASPPLENRLKIGLKGTSKTDGINLPVPGQYMLPVLANQP